MTDDTKVPLWLKFQCYEEETGKTYYVPAKPAEMELCFAVHGSTSWKELHVWLAWRERVAKSLGLVDRADYEAHIAEKATLAAALDEARVELAALWDDVGGIASVNRDKAIAAELRAMAESLCAGAYEGCCYTTASYWDERLRARADELDGGK